jgi:antitoxin (DNA-binding transcriptional repressor) of toxin-antitoxin stability system
MRYVNITDFRKHAKTWLAELPIILTSDNLPVARVLPIDVQLVDKKQGEKHICQIELLSAKTKCVQDAVGKYEVAIQKADDVKSWLGYLCADHLKVLELKDNVALTKI